jgi:hypothetical protein
MTRRAPSSSTTRSLAGLIVATLLASLMVLVGGGPASAVDHTFLIDSLSHQGDDVTPGNAVCRW